MKHVLDYVTKDQIFYEPFPHIVAHNLLPSDIYSELQNSFPSLRTVVDGKEYTSNERFDFTVEQLRKNATIPPVWREFSEAHASESFYRKILEIFGDAIQERYPALPFNLNEARVGTRYIDTHDTADILLDAHIAINTPVTGKSGSVRVAHVDDPRKMYGALLYFRKDEDDSLGGDLELYRYKNDTYKFYGQHVDEKYVEVIKTVPYSQNTFVFFINTIDSLHGVTVRENTPHTRQFLNMIGELKEPLFDIQSRQESSLLKRYRRYKAKLIGQGGKW